MSRRLLAAGLLTTVLGSAYRLLLSSFSQALGPFPYRSRRLGAAEDQVSHRSPKCIALTFDDGPNEPYTSQIADVLVSYGVRGTFFQVGRCVQRYPEVTARLARDGHVVGNHSHSHRLTRCWLPRDQRPETAMAQQAVEAATGRRPALYRPPWLLRTPGLFRILRTAGLTPVSGRFAHPLEVFQPPASRIAQRALAAAEPGGILIFHDGFDARGGNRAQTVDAVRLLVPALLARGYTLVTVDDLLDIAAYRV